MAQKYKYKYQVKWISGWHESKGVSTEKSDDNYAVGQRFNLTFMGLVISRGRIIGKHTWNSDKRKWVKTD